MDPRSNPYSPGAGTRPPELAGRDQIIERAAIALDRIRAGRSARSLLLYGLRGVGKTVLLTQIRLEAEARGFACVAIEAPEKRDLPSLLVPAIRAVLLRLSRSEHIKSRLAGAMEALVGFAKSFKIKVQDVEFGIDLKPSPGLADSGDLEQDLADLLQAVGQAAAAGKTAIILFIDELQYIPEKEFAALISALHKTNQLQLPVALMGAGLPQLVGLAGRAKSYAERLFEYCSIGQLDEEAAQDALCKPAAKEGVTYQDAAIREILKQTQGYPYFLQEWGKHAWNLAAHTLIDVATAHAATAQALAELDQSFFRVRFDRLTPLEKHYLAAMAELGAGPHRSGEIAQKMGKDVQTVAPVRNSLIKKGMIYSPAHGDTAFTVPLFDGFMKRTMAF